MEVKSHEFLRLEHQTETLEQQVRVTNLSKGACNIINVRQVT